MRMHVCTFESSQLEGSYVGDLLYLEGLFLTHMGDIKIEVVPIKNPS